MRNVPQGLMYLNISLKGPVRVKFLERLVGRALLRKSITLGVG